eukprot:2664353-Alexandrium_andersonii.AAC.1
MAVVGVGSWRVTFRLGSRCQRGQGGAPPPSEVVSWCHRSLHVGEPLYARAVLGCLLYTSPSPRD